MASGAATALPLMVPEIDAPADAEEGPTGDSVAFPPQAAASRAVRAMPRIVTCGRTTFMNCLQSGELSPAYLATDIPAGLLNSRAVFTRDVR